MVSPRLVLDIVELIFYVPVLLIATFVCVKHGFSKSSGYLYTVVLSMLRLVGAITGIVSIHSPSVSLIVTSTICSGVGLAPLLLALLAFTRRIHSNSVPGPIVGPKMLRLAFVPILVATILAIVGGTDLASSKPSDVNTGHTYSKVSAGLYLLSLLVVALIVAVTAMAHARTAPSDAKLLFASAAALPFLLIRTVFSVLVAFTWTHPDTFSLITDTARAVAVQACMSVLMEFIVVILYLTAAILTPRLEKPRQGEFVGLEQGQQHGRGQHGGYNGGFNQRQQEPRY